MSTAVCCISCFSNNSNSFNLHTLCIASIYRISEVLRSGQRTGPLVLHCRAINIQLRPSQVLERWFFALLDTGSASQHTFSGPSSTVSAVVRSRASTRVHPPAYSQPPLDLRILPFLATPRVVHIDEAEFTPLHAINNPARHSCTGDVLHTPLRRSYADRPATSGLHARNVLGGSATHDRLSSRWQMVDYLERAVGCDINRVMGRFPTAGMMTPRRVR